MQTFCANILAPKIIKLCFWFKIFLHQIIGEKSTQKMLMKLTHGGGTFKTTDRKKIQGFFSKKKDFIFKFYSRLLLGGVTRLLFLLANNFGTKQRVRKKVRKMFSSKNNKKKFVKYQVRKISSCLIV
jgi:hypothetical protein